MRTRSILFPAFLLAAATGGARAEEVGLTAPLLDRVVLTEARPPSTWAVALYGGVWTNSTLPRFPINLVSGRLTFEDARIVSLVIDRRLFDFGLDIPGTQLRLDGFSLEAEGTVSRHVGLEDHVEATAAVKLRSGEIGLGSVGSMNVAFANGLSWAFERPKWEYGPGLVHGVDSRRLQYYMGFETAFTPKGAKNLSAFVRLHHRSGIYGLISPRRTGSNHFGVGLRWTLD
ncbi:MAG: hypothetical protein OEL76_13950 [Siculibacillus sp.]|nr:hypothetical protein [Siculibacillus sp.]